MAARHTLPPYGEYYSIGEYQPYRIHGFKNPNFGERGRHTLNLKDPAETGFATAVAFFGGELRAFLTTEVKLHPGTCAVVVPSHIAGVISPGLQAVLHSVRNTHPISVEVDLLRRTHTVEKKAYGGNRSIETNFESIIVTENERVVGRHFLLLDDVTTSGNSICACKHLLMQAGAASVIAVALSKR